MKSPRRTNHPRNVFYKINKQQKNKNLAKKSEYETHNKAILCTSSHRTEQKDRYIFSWFKDDNAQKVN